MKVLIIGECYSNNVGDQIVASITKALIGRLYPTSFIYLLDLSGRDGVNTTHIGSAQTLSQQLRTKFLKYIPFFDEIRKLVGRSRRQRHYRKVINSHKYDLAIFCGGQLINSTFTEQMRDVAKLLHHASVPTIYNSVGLGVVNEKDIKIFKKVLEYPNVKSISCRCNEIRFNKFFNFERRKVLGTFDPGICASDFYDISRKNNTTLVGLGVMSSSRISDDRMIAFWKQVISFLDKKSIHWKMFYTGTWKDYLLAKQILTSLNISNVECRINEKINTPVDIINELSQFSKIIAFRLHGHIISYSLGIPTIAIRWDKKIDDFFAKIGYSDRVFQIDSDVSTIMNKLDECEYISNNIIKESINQYEVLFAKQCEEAILSK